MGQGRAAPSARAKELEVVVLAAPPPEQRVGREARFAGPGEKKSRYSLPDVLRTSSPVGYRTRVRLSRDEAEAALELLALERPTGFSPPTELLEQELFEECSLGVLVSRQSTNFRGQRQITLGPEDSRRAAELLRELQGLDAPVLEGATHTHVVLSRRYQTPFTLLLTFVGHKPALSPLTVAWRGMRKRFGGVNDIPTIGYLQHLHVGILADGLERAAVLASRGERRAQVFMAPFWGAQKGRNGAVVRRLEALCGLTARHRVEGWHVALVAQVGNALPDERVPLAEPLCRRLGAALVALRSERVQPGVNAEEKAPTAYQSRQDMDVPDRLTYMAGRAAYNAFAHWTGCSRERSKDLLLLDRIDVLTPGGKLRLRSIRKMLEAITDRVVDNVPLWADLVTGRALTRNANRGRKAFALTGQRIYLAGLSRAELETDRIDWELAVVGLGAAAARSALYAELMGCVEVPEGCDMLAGICLMAGPVNQNDIGKQFYGYSDLLSETYPDRDPTSLLVWLLKAKTVADPVGNEEQLLNAKRKGALVDLRPGPDEVVWIRQGTRLVPMRQQGSGKQARLNEERAFADVGNFVTDPSGREIDGNRGREWPRELARKPVWP